ncbi:hypothetical protein AUC68_14250 [Methyloceanibacter methanicus]|uniref:4-diphosphocytidyl-2-C-methyl-D-erythritol kinase n=1 Tax=Methyloceanibacter methanicus TaxID=1774968 RepID=A0A1E3W4I8_9HYPH|nr:4-(cytidine 5'-diphospho)-2-C-methyl-D-erythritol kinase [Methyloceanibacter methanicus]ODS00735.1 hypothetical protein AUC68_14250 [Methyloceanibacter methanicus]
MRFRDIAWAKLNLTLEVLGRRGDGFHELRSLVAFAGAGDTVEFTPHISPGPRLVAQGAGAPVPPGVTLEVEGPFAGALAGANLMLEAAEAARARVPPCRPAPSGLVKALPVAAGLGGGSADAAAALRLLVAAGEGAFSAEDAGAIAPVLGSDVAVCLRSSPAMITGRGEKVAAVSGFPHCGVVLANPGVELATSAVYGALGAAPLDASPEALSEGAPPLDFGGSFEALIAYASARVNDLEPAARRLAPELGAVISALETLSGARLVRLSGSGATCFAVFATPREALRAAILLAEKAPDWWITAGILGNPRTP